MDIIERKTFLCVICCYYKDGCSGKDPSKKEQVFTILMKNNCAVFSFKDCSFQVQKDREGAARVILFLK
jgi:hypothetical protein